MSRAIRGGEPSREELEFHYCGALLNGAIAPPNSAACTIDRFRRVEEACIALAFVDGEVRPERVGDVLHHLGVFADLGGFTFIHDLMASWLERVARARTLGELLARAEVAAVHIDRERRALEVATRAAERLRAARQASACAVSAMGAP